MWLKTAQLTATGFLLTPEAGVMYSERLSDPEPEPGFAKRRARIDLPVGTILRDGSSEEGGMDLLDLMGMPLEASPIQ